MNLDCAVAEFATDRGIPPDDVWQQATGPRATDWYAEHTYVIPLDNGHALIARQLGDTVTLVLQDHRGTEVRQGTSRPWATTADVAAAMARYAR